MERRIPEILDNNRTLLVRNIIPNQDLMGELKQHKVFTESTVADIQVGAATEL